MWKKECKNQSTPTEKANCKAHLFLYLVLTQRYIFPSNCNTEGQCSFTVFQVNNSDNGFNKSS